MDEKIIRDRIYKAINRNGVSSDDLSSFKNEDVLYHYTLMETALSKILFNKNLKLTKRIDSEDPFESKLSYNIYSQGIDDVVEGKNLTFEIQEAVRVVEAYYYNIRQVCFCENSNDKQTEHIIEYFGCLKPRMWSQYADKYKGLCIAFSKKKLLAQLPNACFHDNIDYKYFYELKNNSFQKHDAEEYKKLGKDGFIEMKKKQVIDTSFNKPKDYENENEFRICYYGDEISDVFIDIKDAILGLFISNTEGSSNYFHEKIYEESLRLKVPAYSIKWRSRGIEKITLLDKRPSSLF